VSVDFVALAVLEPFQNLVCGPETDATSLGQFLGLGVDVLGQDGLNLSALDDCKMVRGKLGGDSWRHMINERVKSCR